jgi:hypothetical protein
MLSPQGYRVFLTIVTESLQSGNEAELLGEAVLSALDNGWTQFSIQPYNKFSNSYKIEFELFVGDKEPYRLNNWAIATTNRLCAPWLVYYDDDTEMIELIFNKSENSKFGIPELASIRWAHCQAV